MTIFFVFYYVYRLGEDACATDSVEVQLLSSKYILESTNYDASMIQDIKHFPRELPVLKHMPVGSEYPLGA